MPTKFKATTTEEAFFITITTVGWINIYSNSTDWGLDEVASYFGKQWIPNKSNPTIFHETKFSHGRAGKMFTETLDNYLLCSSDFLFDNIRTYLNKQ